MTEIINRPLRTAKSGQIFEELGGVPDLPGAACVGHHQIFDATPYRSTVPVRTIDEGDINPDEARATAKQICGRCPVLDQCRQWVNSLRPEDRPGGIVAGKMYARRPPRRYGKIELNEEREEWRESVVDLINRL